MEQSIHIGFLPEFKGSDTLLLLCSLSALDSLADLARALSSPESVPVAVHSLPNVIAHAISLEARLSTPDVGIRRFGSQFTWLRSSEGWRNVHDLVLSLRGSKAAHQYLEGPADEVTVMLSVGEYSESVWHRAG